MAVRHPADRLGHGGREQGDLPLRRRVFENPVHILDEAHSQHFIGLVQHQGTQTFEHQTLPAQVIHDMTRRADHHMRPAFELAELVAHALTTVDGQHMKAGR